MDNGKGNGVGECAGGSAGPREAFLSADYVRGGVGWGFVELYSILRYSGLQVG